MEINQPMWESFVDNVDNLVHNSFLAENKDRSVWTCFFVDIVDKVDKLGTEHSFCAI